MWNTFLLYVVVEIQQLVNEISSFPELLYLQNSQINIFARAFFLIKLQAGNLKLSEAATGDVL